MRIVAATHRDLRLHDRQGLFREDLFYRLNVVPIRLPPLRERDDDVVLLAEHYLQSLRKELPSEAEGFDAHALAALRGYPWPGNVRELENLVRRLCRALQPRIPSRAT